MYPQINNLPSVKSEMDSHIFDVEQTSYFYTSLKLLRIRNKLIPNGQKFYFLSFICIFFSLQNMSFEQIKLDGMSAAFLSSCHHVQSSPIKRRVHYQSWEDHGRVTDSYVNLSDK